MNERERLIDILKGLVGPIVKRSGFELYDLNFAQSRKRTIVRVVLDNPCGFVSVDDCAKMSSLISAALDLEDSGMFEGRYYLEVSSPGIERKLRSIDDCRRFIGSLVSYKLKDGSQKSGSIKNVNDNKCFIDIDGEIVHIRFSDIEDIHIKMDFDKELGRK
jgi:ribosome maturation factor RimP